jgi:hypothetical protein
MTIRSIMTTAALTLTAIGTAAGAASAAPPTPGSPNTTERTDVAPGIHYTAGIVDQSVMLRTDAGSLTTRSAQFQVLDEGGNLVTGFPLTYQRDGKDWPIAVQIDGNTAALTLSTDPATAVASRTPMAHPVDAQTDFNNAIGVAANNMGLATAVGALGGTIVGGCVGGVAGAVVGAALMPPIFLPGAAGGCLAGAAAGIALGAATGTVLLGVPVGIASAIQFFNTINTPTAPAST